MPVSTVAGSQLSVVVALVFTAKKGLVEKRSASAKRKRFLVAASRRILRELGEQQFCLRLDGWQAFKYG